MKIFIQCPHRKLFYGKQVLPQKLGTEGAVSAVHQKFLQKTFCRDHKSFYGGGAENKYLHYFQKVILITAVLFRLKWNATKQEMQSAVDYTGELLGVQLESIRNTMSFISLDLLSNEKFLTADVYKRQVHKP